MILIKHKTDIELTIMECESELKSGIKRYIINFNFLKELCNER